MELLPIRPFAVALRRLRRSPWETALAVVALGLGLGVVAASYAVVDAVLLRPLPVDDAERLVALVQTRVDDGSQYTTAYPNADRWRRAKSLQGLAVSRAASWALMSEDGTARRIRGHEVEPGFFTLLGLTPRSGRTLSDASVDPNIDPRAEASLDGIVVSDRFWRTEMGGDPEAVGRSIRFADGTRTVVGVMPALPDLHRLSLGDVWAPLDIGPDAAAPDSSLRGLRVHARLRDGVALAAARAELDAIAAAFAAERPATQEGWSVSVEPIEAFVLGSYRQPLLGLLAVASLVLLVAISTVGCLAVARGLDRRSEIAVRRALGADGRDLSAAWLVEWCAVGLLAGLLSLPLAQATLRLVVRASIDRVPLLAQAGLGGSVPVFLLATALAAGLAAGLLGLRSLLRPGRASRAGSSAGPSTWSDRSVTAGDDGVRTALVAIQTGLAVVALVAALLLGRSLAALGEVETGFAPEGLLTFQLELPVDRNPESKDARRQIWQALLERLEAVPGVDAAAVTTSAPLTGYAGIFEVWIEGQSSDARSATPDLRTLAQIGSPGLIAVAGIERLAGRDFEPGETWDSHHSVQVNHAFVREQLGAADDPRAAIGRRLRWQNGEVGEIVGVVDDVRETALHLDAEPEIYMAWGAVSPRQTVMLRAGAHGGAGASPDSILRGARRVVSELLPGAPLHGVATGPQLVAGELAQRRLLASLSGVFATLAQVLALLGLYGVVAGRLARARRSIAIRMAVGARARDIRRWTLRTGLAPVLVGGAAGLAVAWAASGLLRDQLFGVQPVDAVSYLAALAVALAGSWLAASVPARRAARLDPARTLRETG